MRSGWILTRLFHYQSFISLLLFLYPLLIPLLLTKSRLSSHQAASPFRGDWMLKSELGWPLGLLRKSSCSSAAHVISAHVCDYETIGKML